MASAGSSELVLVVRQTTHWRSAPSKSQPALFVAQICSLHQWYGTRDALAASSSYLFSIQHPLIAFERGSCDQPQSTLL